MSTKSYQLGAILQSLSRIRILIIALFLFSSSAFSQETKPIAMEEIMKQVSKGRQYVLAFLKKGSTETTDTLLQQKLQMEHLQFLFTLKEQKKISIFGPVLNGNDLEGIIIFNSDKIDEVKKILDNEPYMKQGMMKYELFQWFGLPGAVLPQ